MFFIAPMSREIEVHPRHFGPKLREALQSQINKEVEGTCSGRYGYIVTVMNLINRSPGAIRDGTGFATFQVNFQALVFRPFKDEVLPASVDVVNKVGFFCTSGPLKMFVSTHLIPEEFKYETEDEPAFVSSDEEVRIRAGSNVRVRIVGVRLDANECHCVASIKEDYLGLIG